jgi:hypothetical protein
MREKRHAPRELQSLIELANSVPPDSELPPSHGRVEEVLGLLRTSAFKNFRDLIGGTDADTFVSKFVENAPKTYRRVIGEYNRLRDSRAWLRQTARIGQQPLKMKYLMPNVSAYVNERGELEFNINPLVKAFQGAEAARIRLCSICKLIFWASRADKPCCSLRCAKILRSRNYREGYKLKYQTQRKLKKMAHLKLAHQRERKSLSRLKITPGGPTRRAARVPGKEKQLE